MDVDYSTRLYRYWPGKNRFFCGGNIITGPDYHRAILTFIMISGPEALFLAFPGYCMQFERDKNYVYPISIFLFTFTIAFMLLASTTNPGFIPKQLSHFAKGPLGAPSLPLALSQDCRKSSPFLKKYFDIQVNGAMMKLKYCDTCTIYIGMILRPPRSSHCADCDVCVEKFDHHCPWLGNCIGKRNYKHFIGFLVNCFSLIVFNFVITVLHLIWIVEYIEEEENVSGDEAIERSVKYGGTVWFVIGLLCFHIYLLLTNQTTNETLKGVWRSLRFNPYKRTIIKNTYSVLCSKNYPRYFDLTSKVSVLQDQIMQSPSKEALIRPVNFQETVLEDNRSENITPKVNICTEVASGSELNNEVHITNSNSRRASRPKNSFELSNLDVC